MTPGMQCQRAEQLLSDLLEDRLEEPLRGELLAHLGACAECRALREAMAEVLAALQSFPSVEPSATLADRVATAALRERLAGRAPVFGSGPPRRRDGRLPRVPAWIQSLAAGFALVTTGLVLLTTRSEAPRRAAARFVDTTVSTGAYLAERKDRLVEDVHVLRVVIETAFEGRLERINERVIDYRRLLERQKPAGSEREKTTTRRNFLNRDEGGPVSVS
jgi:anti-sigma factor RsiW